MLGFKKKKRMVCVTCIDSQTKQPFAQSELSIDDLPQTFEANPLFVIENEHWKVLEAIPMTSSEFSKSRELTLIMKKTIVIKNVDPNTLLVTLPTISNGLPLIKPGSSKLNKKVFEMKEDDWRQIDILPDTEWEQAEKNLAAIREIYAEKKCSENGTTFNSIHIREGLDDPFSGRPIKKVLLCSDFPGATEYEGVSFRNVAGIVKNSFALGLHNGLTLYGLIKTGCFCTLSVWVEKDTSKAALEDLSRILEKYGLFIIDWCNMEVYRINK